MLAAPLSPGRVKVFHSSRNNHSLESPRLTLSILPILIARDRVHTVARGAIPLLDFSAVSCMDEEKI